VGGAAQGGGDGVEEGGEGGEGGDVGVGGEEGVQQRPEGGEAFGVVVVVWGGSGRMEKRSRTLRVGEVGRG
jgi:hypothetical protein